jgi:hypothetical protein
MVFVVFYDFGTVLTVWYLLLQFQNHRKQQIPYSQNSSKIIENNKYPTVRTVPKSNRKIVRRDKINTLYQNILVFFLIFKHFKISPKNLQLVLLEFFLHCFAWRGGLDP